MAVTGAELVWELFAPFGSDVVLVTVAVLLMNEPFGALGFTFRINVIIDEPTFEGYVVTVQVIVPVAPGSGVEQIKAPPETELKVVLGGVASVTVTV